MRIPTLLMGGLRLEVTRNGTWGTASVPKRFKCSSPVIMPQQPSPTKSMLTLVLVQGITFPLESARQIFPGGIRYETHKEITGQQMAIG